MEEKQVLTLKNRNHSEEILGEKDSRIIFGFNFGARQVCCGASYLMQSEHSMSPLSNRSAGKVLAPRAAAL